MLPDCFVAIKQNHRTFLPWLQKCPVFIFIIKKQLLFPDANKHRFLKCKKKTDMSAFLEIENEFDNFDNYDNYNLNLLLIKRIILRSLKTGFPTCSLEEFKPFLEY